MLKVLTQVIGRFDTRLFSQVVNSFTYLAKRIFIRNVFLVLAQTILEVIKIFVQFHCLSSYGNDQTCDLACSGVGVREMSLYKVASKKESVSN